MGERTIEDCETQRERIAFIIEDVAKNGLPNPRDLDVALDAIDAEYASVTAERDRLHTANVIQNAVTEELHELNSKLEAERDELKTRTESFDAELREAKEHIIEEFDRDASNVLKKIIDETEYEIDPHEGWRPEDVLEHIRECFSAHDNIVKTLKAERDAAREELQRAIFLLRKIVDGRFGGQPGYINSLALQAAEEFLARAALSESQKVGGGLRGMAETRKPKVEPRLLNKQDAAAYCGLCVARIFPSKAF